MGDHISKTEGGRNRASRQCKISKPVQNMCVFTNKFVDVMDCRHQVVSQIDSILTP